MRADIDVGSRTLTTVAHLIARTLRAHGAQALFGLRDEHDAPLVASCADLGIRFVGARDQRSAAWMATGWALATATPGIVALSSPAGVADAAAPLVDAVASGIPIVVLAGIEHEELELSADVRPRGAWAARLDDQDSAGILTARAFAAARAHPGVAVLEVPARLQDATTSAAPEQPAIVNRPEPDSAEIAQAWTLLARAERPVIMAGGGCFWSGATAALEHFATASRIPVVTAGQARGILPGGHPLCAGIAESPAGRAAVHEADVVLAVGTRCDAPLAATAPDAVLVRIDSEAGPAADLFLRADPRAALEALGRVAESCSTNAWIALLRDRARAGASRFSAAASTISLPLHPAAVVAEVTASLPVGAIVYVDEGPLAAWAMGAVPVSGPGDLQAHMDSRTGAAGMGLPIAVGMKIACPDRALLVLCGDASFTPGAMALETAARHGAPIAVVVAGSEGRAGRAGMPRSPFEMMAEFAGGIGDRAETPKQLSIAVPNALVASMPSVVNVRIDAGVRAPEGAHGA
ncbi:MAG: thiamine pyrophosphate-binding protein [Actinomycetota bacterium]